MVEMLKDTTWHIEEPERSECIREWRGFRVDIVVTFAKDPSPAFPALPKDYFDDKNGCLQNMT